MIDNLNNPYYLNDFLAYISTILNKSPNTVKEYNYDLSHFLKYIKYRYGLAKIENISDIKNITINDFPLSEIEKITLQDIHSFLAYLKENVRILEEYFPQDGEFPHIRQEGTYLSWIDMRALGLKTPAGKILEESSVWLHEGSVFGQGGEGYVRMNIACPESVLREALERIQKALARV